MKNGIAVLSITVFAAFSLADSKSEADLRHRLESSEAARVKASEEFKASLSRLSSSGAQSSQATNDASRRASIDARSAQLDSATSTAMISQASEMARFQSEQLRHTTIITSVGVMVSQLMVLMGIIAGFIHTALMTSRNHKWAVEKAMETERSVERQYKVIAKLEENTNSIKDALVESTEKEAYARGVLHGGSETDGGAKSNDKQVTGK
jgi:hypothetical protein